MNAKKEWWKDMFSSQWLDIQRQSKTGEETCTEVDFIQKVLRLKSKAKVLDVPCGDGRHSIELASRGFEVTGVDIALPLLDDAERRARERKVDVTCKHLDMRHLPWQEEFDGAFCFWGSFGYFDEEDNANFLSTVSRCIKSGCRFLIDTHISETLLMRLSREREWRRVGDSLVLEEKHYDYKSGRTDTEWIIIKEGKMFKNSTSIRLYTYRELCHLCESAGFGNFEAYGSIRGEPFSLSSPRLYLLMVKI